MKRIIIPVCVSLLLISFGGCDNKEPTENVEAHTTASISETTETADTEPLEKYVITCGEIADIVMSGSSAEFPHHMEVTDDVMISDVMGYDLSLTTDHSINTQMISADLFELTLFRADEENSDNVLKMLEERKDYLKERAAFYPAQVEAADATVVSCVDDIYYLICHKDAKNIEKALITAIKSN